MVGAREERKGQQEKMLAAPQRQLAPVPCERKLQAGREQVRQAHWRVRESTQPPQAVGTLGEALQEEAA